MDIGVFDETELLAAFGDGVAADEYRRSVLELDRPEGFRRSEHNEHQVFVAPVPDEYDLWARLLTGLRRSRSQDRMEARHDPA